MVVVVVAVVVSSEIQRIGVILEYVLRGFFVICGFLAPRWERIGVMDWWE